MFSVIIISCLGIILYSNTFFASFQFDDRHFIIENFSIRNIQNLQNIWNFCPCRFITYITFAFNYHFHQLNVLGYHIFNLVIHLGSAILVWWLTLLTLSTPAMKNKEITQHASIISLFTGLVFVAHPIQTQGVTYIVQRTASMATFFYLASLSFYVKSRLTQEKDPASRSSRFYYISSLVIAIIAMFTKEMTITLPLMICFCEFSFLKTERVFHWKHLVPFLFTLFIIPLTLLLTKSADLQEMQRMLPDISPARYLFTQFRVMVTYIRLVFLPLNQNLDYDYHISKSIFELPTLISLLFLIIIIFSAKRIFSKYKLVSFGIFWFFLTLLPESSPVPIKDVIFEHRLYLPLVGYSIFLVTSMYYIFGKKSFKVMVVALSIIVTCYSVLTYQRNKVWKDEFVLWDDTVGKSPHKARPYSSRGVAYYYKGNFAQAISDLTKSIKINPNYAEAYNNRAGIYAGQGQFAQAISDCARAIKISPNYAETYNNRAGIYNGQGNFAQAISDCTKAIEINPNYAEAYNNRGSVYYRQGNFAQAISDYTKVIEMDTNNAEAYNTRGTVYYKQGNFAQAISDFSRAVEINTSYVEAYNNRAGAYGNQGSFLQAIADYSRAIEINPNCIEAYGSRGVVYYAIKEYDKAWKDVNKTKSLGYTPNPELMDLLKKERFR